MVAGGIATLLMRGLIFAATITAVTELFSMEDPVIIKFEQPISFEDMDKYSSLKLSDYDYVIAVRQG